jgi:RNAse (barnase) inhibitor barstar
MGKLAYDIDGYAFQPLEEFFEVISRVLTPSFDWGKNLDAFNDILRGGFGTSENGFVLRWKNSHESRRQLGYPETVRQLERRLALCHPTNRQSLSVDLERARKGVGPTVFDWLVEINLAHSRDGPGQNDGVELILE